MTLDTLQILIEADAAGLKSQLLRAGDNIKNFVSSMNKEEVNWTSILSRTISPAIISGVAATFAMAITNMLQFQNAVATTGNMTADSFSSNSAAVSKEITGLSNTWGVARTDITDAAGYVYKAFGDTAESAVILSKASALASGSNGLLSVQEAAQKMTDVLVAWNITTAPEAAASLDRIFNASKNSKLSFSEFTDVLIENGPQMRNIGLKVDDMAIAMEAFSQTSGITGDNIKETFALITDAATNSGSKLVGILGSNGTVSKEIRDNGFGSVIKELSDKISGLGTSAVTVLGSLGVSPNLVSSLQNSNDALQNIQDRINELKKTPVVTIEVDVKDKWSVMQSLKSIMDTVLNSFGDGLKNLFSGDMALQVGNLLVNGIKSAFNSMFGGENYLSEGGKGKPVQSGTANSTTMYYNFQNVNNINESGAPAVTAQNNTAAALDLLRQGINISR